MTAGLLEHRLDATKRLVAVVGEACGEPVKADARGISLLNAINDLFEAWPEAAFRVMANTERLGIKA